MVSWVLIDTVDDSVVHGTGDQGRGTHGDQMKEAVSSGMPEVILVILKIICSFGSWSSSENCAW